MTSQIITSLSVTAIVENAPTTNYSTKGAAYLRQGSGNDAQIYVRFGLPGPKGATYQNTKLRLYNAGGAIPSQAYALRLVTASFNTSTLKWANKPSNTTTGQVNVTAAVAAKGAAGDYLEFDITNLMNTVSQGTTPWYGVMIYTVNTDNTRRDFFTAKGTTVKKPVVDATWSTAPLAPTGLNPANDTHVSVQFPIFNASFIDLTGVTVLDALQIQIHSTSDFSGAVDFDSGTVSTTIPQYDSSTGAFAGISNAQSKYYRLRWRANGTWSDWSAVTKFNRTNKGTVAITTPAASPNDFVEDVTPPVAWSFTGTQKNAQLLIWNDDKTAIIYNSNKITTNVLGLTVSDQTPLTNNVWYRLEARVWDDVARATLANDVPYASAERRFLVKTTASVTPTTDLTVVRVGTTPWAQLDFKRTSSPDFFDIFRDNVLIASNINPADLFVSGTSYRFIDRGASPRITHTWEVRAKVNNQTSSSNATATLQIKPLTAYLSALDGSMTIPIFSYTSNMEYGDGSTVVDILNSDRAITVFQGMSGQRGDFSGVLSKIATGLNGNETARDHLNNLLALRAPQNRGKPCVLTYKDQAMVVIVSKIKYSATVYKEEIAYAVSFFATERPGVIQ